MKHHSENSTFWGVGGTEDTVSEKVIRTDFLFSKNKWTSHLWKPDILNWKLSKEES